MKTQTFFLANLLLTGGIANAQQKPTPLFEFDFNADTPGLNLKNGGSLDVDRSGVSGKTGDRAYVGTVADPKNPLNGPMAALTQRVQVAGLEQLTFTGWYKAKGEQPGAVTLLDGAGLTILGDKPGEWTVRVNAPVLDKKFYWFYSGKDVPASNWRPVDEWRFFAFTWKRSDSEGQFYSGSKDVAVALSRSTKIDAVPTSGLQQRALSDKKPDVIGNTSRNEADRPFNGLIDDVRLYDRVLSAEALEAIRVADLKNQPLPQSPAL